MLNEIVIDRIFFLLTERVVAKRRDANDNLIVILFTDQTKKLILCSGEYTSTEQKGFEIDISRFIQVEEKYTTSCFSGRFLFWGTPSAIDSALWSVFNNHVKQHVRCWKQLRLGSTTTTAI